MLGTWLYGHGSIGAWLAGPAHLALPYSHHLPAEPISDSSSQDLEITSSSQDNSGTSKAGLTRRPSQPSRTACSF